MQQQPFLFYLWNSQCIITPAASKIKVCLMMHSGVWLTQGRFLLWFDIKGASRQIFFLSAWFFFQHCRNKRGNLESNTLTLCQLLTTSSCRRWKLHSWHQYLHSTGIYIRFSKHQSQNQSTHMIIHSEFLHRNRSSPVFWCRSGASFVWCLFRLFKGLI